jgi:signal transduction histidine kinase
MLNSDPGGVPDGVYNAVERQILDLFDSERSQIGRDLHDGVGQLLTGVSLRCKVLERRLRAQGQTAEADELFGLAKLVDDVIRRIREVVSGLAPNEIHDQDAATALRQLCQQIETVHHVRCVFVDTPSAPLIDDPQTVRHLYFITAEAIHNAIRHGEADQIEVRLHPVEEDGKSELTIQDNGYGDPHQFRARPGVGICGMRMRAQALDGNLHIQDTHRGITVTCLFSTDR